MPQPRVTLLRSEQAIIYPQTPGSDIEIDQGSNLVTQSLLFSFLVFLFHIKRVKYETYL